MSAFEQSARKRYRDRRVAVDRDRALKDADQLEKVTRFAERKLERQPGTLEVGLSSGGLWIFRYEGFEFWVKHVGGERVYQLFVVSFSGGGLPVDDLEQLGMWLERDQVTRV